MSTDYFAHGLYGVILDEAETNMPDAKLEKSGKHEEDFLADVNKRNPKWLKDLKNKYKAPDGTILLHTGSEWDRPGECQTPPDLWAIGVGLMGVHELNEFQALEWDADYWTWVEVSQ